MSSVVVRIAGDDTQLQAALTRAQKGLAQFRTQVGTTVKTLGKYTAAVTAAGAAMTAALVARQSQAIDSTAKFSDQIGISTTTLTQYQYAAREAANVTDQTFNMALRRMTRRISEAAKGTGPAAKSIQELGLSAKELQDAGPAQAFATLSDAIKNTGDQSDRLRIAFSLFDTDGGALLPMINQGSEGLRKYAEEADALGQSFSRIDAAQVEAANSAMARIRNIITGIGNQLAIQLAPYITEVASRFTALGKSAGGIGNVISSVVEKVMRGWGGVANAIHYVKVGFQGLAVVAQAIGVGIIKVGSHIYKGWNKVFEGVFSMISGLIKQANRIPGINIPTDGIDRLRDSFKASAKAAAEFEKQAVEGLKQSLSDLHDSAMKPLPSDAVEQYLEGVKERSRQAAEEMAAAREQMFVGGGDSGLSEEELAAIQQRLEKLQESFATEQEMLTEKYEAELLLLRESLENKLLTQEEFDDLMLASQERYQEQLTAIEEKASEQRQRIAEMEARAKRDAIGKMMSDLSTLINSESRKQFEIGKKAAIAQTAADTYVGAQKAFNALADIPVVGPALGAAASIAAIAAGHQRVSAIRSQSFGGSGGAGAAASNTEAVNAASAPVGRQQQAPVIRLEGISPDSLYSGNQIVGLVGAINDFVKDGGVLLTS